MKRFHLVLFAAPLAILLADLVHGAGFLSSSDSAIAIDANGKTARSNYPGPEGPLNLIDGNAATKYLNFGHSGSGVIVTPAAATPVESLQLTTANDAPARDPASWELWGYNGALMSADNSAGLNELWTLIDAGVVTLPGDPTIGNDQRGVLGPLVDVNSGGVGYQHYKVVFPTIKDLARTNSMQVAELQLFADNAGTSGILAPGNPVRAINFGFESRYPLNESPARALDQDPNTKYLNFGEEQSGLIITNAEGPSPVAFMQLTTANDAPDRDPASYQLWGTNDVITSADNTDGINDENWTLLSMGALALPAARLDSTTWVPINSVNSYSSYKLVFPTVKNAGATNSMQIADVQFYAVPEPTTIALALLGLTAGAYLRRKG